MVSEGFSFRKPKGRRVAAWLILVAASAALAGASVAGATGSVALVQVSAAPKVPAASQRLGALSPATDLSGAVVLKPRDNAALQRFIAAVSTPGSSLFQHYLAPGTFAARFGPAETTINAVKKQLTNDGLNVAGVSRDGLFVSFRGTAARVQRAFHIGFERYRLAGGPVGHMTTSAPELPASIARSVAAVVGLDTLVRVQPLDVMHPPRSSSGTRRKAVPSTGFPHPPGAPKACHAASTAAASFGGLTDDEIAHTYGAFGLYGAGDLAAGQHIALYELEPFLRSDIKVFDTCYFGASRATKMLARLHVVRIDGGQPTGTGSGEALLDVEDLSAMAPDASIDVYEGPSPSADGVEYDPINNYVAMVDADRDDVISTSWGLCEQSIQDGQPGLQAAENLLFEQAAAQGQTIFAAAGDNGSDDCGSTKRLAKGQNPVSVDDPGSQPYVMSVGGTSIDDASRQPPVEQVWNDGGAGGAGGGGISHSWTMPAWQRQATVPGIPKPGSADYKNGASVERRFGYPTGFCQSDVRDASSSTPCRVVPDVSSQADEVTGAITVYQAAYGGWGPTGGTSSATPIWAAMLADVNASPTCKSKPITRHGVGFANPLFYAVASVAAEYPASFNDVRRGNNDIYGLDKGLVFPATKGYDLASGLGSPRLSGPGDAPGLAYYMCSLGASAKRPVVVGLSPVSGSVSARHTVKITGRGFESGGKPDVAYIEVGTAQLGRASFHVDSASTISATLPPARDTRPPHAPAPQNGAGAVQVIVVLSNGAPSAPSPRSRFEYVDTSHAKGVPGISGVVPIGGAESAPPGTVTILGAGFTGARRVTFGGVPAIKFKVVGPNRITATPPRYSHRTVCSALPHTGVYKGENATNDICQVQVRVAGRAGSSATGRIRPPLEGAIKLNHFGDLVAPAHCGCEIAPAVTEFDYLPKPKITSVSSASGGPRRLASETKGTLITVHGAGLGPLTVEWADFGKPSLASSMDTNFVYETGTEMKITALTHKRTVGRVRVPFSVKTIAGQSASRPVTYAGVPTISGVINEKDGKRLHGVYGVPDTGGTAIRIVGSGFAGQLLSPIKFADAKSGARLSTQYKFTIHGNGEIDTHSVAQLPTLDAVKLCTVSGCSHNSSHDELYAYAPGNPRVLSVKPSGGPAGGGTKVKIHGDDLGCALEVFFGNKPAKSFSRLPTMLVCGSATGVDAVSPPGTTGARVPVFVKTVESYFTGSGRGTTSAHFTYK